MKNDIIEFYRGIPIRNYNKLQLRVSQFEFKKFIDAKKDMNLSVRDVLEYSGKLCDNCIISENIIINKKIK